MKLRTFACASLAVLFALAETAFAAILSTSVTQQGGTPPTLDSTFGTVKAAYNFRSGAGGDLTHDGIDFTGYSGVPSGGNPVTATVATTPFTIELAALGDLNQKQLRSANINAATNGHPLFETEIYTWHQGGSNSDTPLRLTVSGLDPAETYRIQILHGEPRPTLTYSNGTVTFTDSASNAATEQLTFGGAAELDHRFALVTATVTNTTSLTYDMPFAGRGASIAGITIQYTPIPEPASAALLLCSGCAAALIRRR